MEEKKKLLAALAKARDAVPYLKKDLSVGSGSWGYKALGIEQVLGAVRPELVKNGILTVPKDMQIVADQSYDTGKHTMRRVSVRVDYLVTHAPSSEAIEVCGIGEGADHGDKAIPKAVTGAFKAMLRQLLSIETGDADPDVTHSDALAKHMAEPVPIEKEATDKARADMAEKIRTAIGQSNDKTVLEKRWKAARDRHLQMSFTDDQWLTIEAAYKELKEFFAIKE